MVKSVCFALAMIAAGCGLAQNFNNNAFGNLSATNLDNAPQAQVIVGTDNNNNAFDNINNPPVQQAMQQQLPSIPQQAMQQVAANPKSNDSENKSVSLALPKLSFGTDGGGSGGRSSARRHNSAFSKKMKRFGRKLNYVFHRKGNTSFIVDTCFAWAK